MAHTDFFNLLANTITAPILIYRGWRKEPLSSQNRLEGRSLCVRGPHEENENDNGNSATVLYDHKGHPFYILKPEGEERKNLVKELLNELEKVQGSRWYNH